MYIQCTVQRIEGTSVLKRTIWGNADKAIVGNSVKIEENDGSWSEPWEVIAIHGNAISKKRAVENSHLHTKQRKASDI